MGEVIDEFSGMARARATITGLKNYVLKVLWWLCDRGLDFSPPSSRSLAMAFVFLVDLRGCAGAAQKTSEACAFTERLNDWPEGLLGGAARIPLDAAQRILRHQAQKKQRLELEQARLILVHYAALRAGRPVVRQWQLAVGAAIGAGFRAWARFNGLAQMKYDEGLCTVHATHIDFLVEHRKNKQLQGDTVTVARPTDGSEGVLRRPGAG